MTTVRIALAVMMVCVVSLVSMAGEKKADGPAAGAKGTTTGVIAKIDGGKVTLKHDETQTVFFPYWRGGMPKDGGGFDKETLKKLESFKAGDRATIGWTMEEHPRIDSIVKAE